ncbi:hypothetical protein, partial [uncultured Duncaniella sp.]|uniref:hypothetical protein n=1 Tax=uncultured Duncaniella sp. TaxID=2768039 RepID=UPI0027120AE8
FEKAASRNEAIVKNEEELAGGIFDLLLDDDGSVTDNHTNDAEGGEIELEHVFPTLEVGSRTSPTATPSAAPTPSTASSANTNPMTDLIKTLHQASNVPDVEFFHPFSCK